jgi:hypothetical protein
VVLLSQLEPPCRSLSVPAGLPQLPNAVCLTPPELSPVP